MTRRALIKLPSLIAHAFVAWLACGFLVYGSRPLLPESGQTPLRWAAVLLCFLWVFRLYFGRPGSLRPLPASGLAIAFIALLDLFLISPAFVLDFWNWQLPAALAAGGIYAASLGHKKGTDTPSARHHPFDSLSDD
ncbi:MAG: hypothetical protein HY549_10390 [Elusimicrobia bacterium]|nr:hypothetical protein [Elusimicrobiota bacterium]